MVTVIIKEWNESKSWANWGGHEKDQFISRVRERSSITNTELKRLAKGVLDKSINIIKLDLITDKMEAECVRHLLESIGAEIEIT